MAWELVYTSAAQGLANGRRGFCTVAATAGMPASLIPRIEALSGYRPAFGAEAPPDAVHPVQHTHVRLAHAGEELSVLSRIVHAGHDYSGRTNKLAHHVVLDPHEQRACAERSPAGWIRAFDGWLHTWEGEPRTLPPRVIPAMGPAAGPPCRGWAAATGDAGHAGHLAERFLLDPSRPICLLHDPTRHDALALMDEAGQLLPPASRWQATFATYFTDPLPESGATWRCVVAGTDAAERFAAGGAAAEVVDLLGPLPAPASTRYVDLARGRVAAEPAAATSAAPEPVTPRTAKSSAASVSLSPPPSPTPPPGKAAPPPPIQASTSRPPEGPPADRPRSVPASWFWAALVGWPIVLGAAWAWTGSRAEGASQEREVVSVLETQGPQGSEPGPDSASAPAASPASGPTEPKPEAAAAAVAPRPIAASPGASPAAPAGVPATNPAAAPAPSSAEPPFAPAATLPGAAWPPWLAAPLPAPSLGSSGAFGVGALATLQPATASLTGAVAGPAVHSVELHAAGLGTTESLGLRWNPSEGGAVLALQERDALGGVRSTEIGRAEMGNRARATPALVWRWLPAPLDRARAEALDALGAEAALSLWELRDAEGQTLSRVQGFVPEALSVGIDAAEGLALLEGPLTRSLTVSDVSMSVEPPSSAWRLEPLGDSGRAVLRGPGGAELRLRLERGPQNTVRFRAAWQARGETLEADIAADQLALDADLAWLGALSAAEEAHRAALAALPKNAEGAVDESKRSAPAWREAFADAAEAARERKRIRCEREGEPEELRAGAAQRERRLARQRAALAAMAAFPGCEVRVQLARSGARLAEVRVTR